MSSQPKYKGGVLVRISPDGKKILHLHNDVITHKITSKIADIEIDRVTDIYFNNSMRCWRVLICDTGEILGRFKTREEALEFERGFLEEKMRRHEG